MHPEPLIKWPTCQIYNRMHSGYLLFLVRQRHCTITNSHLPRTQNVPPPRLCWFHSGAICSGWQVAKSSQKTTSTNLMWPFIYIYVHIYMWCALLYIYVYTCDVAFYTWGLVFNVFMSRQIQILLRLINRMNYRSMTIWEIWVSSKKEPLTEWAEKFLRLFYFTCLRYFAWYGLQTCPPFL